MAGLSFPVVHAVAQEVVDQVDAPASVLTRVPVALVHVWNASDSVSSSARAFFLKCKIKIQTRATELSATTQEPPWQN